MVKKILFVTFVLLTLVLTSCTNDDINISTTPKTRTLTYVVNTQSMYDVLGLTSEVVSNYLGKNCNVGVYTFIYDAEQNLVTTQSSQEASFGTVTKTFQLGEGAYTVVTYETLVGHGYTPSWSGEDKLSTLTFNDNSSSDHHYVLGSVETKVSLVGGDKTETASPATTRVLLTLNINVKSMYDEFGITEDLTNDYLRDSKAPIGLFTYIYNSQGDLVDSVKIQQYSLNNAILTRSLDKGDYTILTIETLVDSSTKEPDFWRFSDTKNLTAVKMKQIYSNPSRYNAVGVATTNVNLTGNKNVSVTNKSIGSILNFYAFNFESTSYAQIGFGTTDLLDYYSLNPQLSRDEKFVESLSESNHFTTRGLKMTPEETASIYKTIYVLESKIDWEFAVQRDATSGWNFWEEGKANLEDGKTYYAGFYYLYSDDESTYFRTFFGSLADFRTWKSEADEYIKSLDPTTLFEEPYITWGGTVASVKSFMSGYVAFNSGDLEKTGDYYVLTYLGKYREGQIRYWFSSPTGGLENVVVFFDSQNVGEDELLKAFNEMGYKFVESGDGYSIYRTGDGKTELMMGLNDNNYWYVMYYSAFSASSRSITMKSVSQTIGPKRQRVHTSKNLKYTYTVNSLRQCEKTMKLYFK